MLEIFEPIRDFGFLSLIVRLMLAVISGGVIGAEREVKRRPAGFRTHILICLGAAVTSLTGQFLSVGLHYYTDMTRLGAQVIAGIGFIGAGAIITTPGHQIHGLTTSAGLWASAIVGLCYGAGFYEGGITATLLILAAEIFLSRLEHRLWNSGAEITVFVSCPDRTAVSGVLKELERMGVKVVNLELGKAESGPDGKKGRVAILQLHPARGQSGEDVLLAVRGIEGVEEAEIL